MADDEATRQRELRDIKQQRLDHLERQAALFGYDEPPHIAMERAQLRKELGILEVVVDRAPRPEFVEDLGQSGRFGLTYAELKRANDAIALLGERMDSFIESSREWRIVHRQWIILIGVVLVCVLILVTIVATVVFSRGG